MYYVAHRLFALHDRALGALVASELAERVGAKEVFLPFCDTDEEALVSDCKGRTLFELDGQRLRALDGMIAILHGPSLDDGVCMEIGYAAQVGVPIVVLTTDFQTYGIQDAGPELSFPDPLLDALVADVVRVSRLAPSDDHTPEDRFFAFLDRNISPLRQAARSAVESLLLCRGRPQMEQEAPSTAETERCAFLEPSPYGSDRWEDVRALLRSRGWDVRSSGRWDLRPGVGHSEMLDNARGDWKGLAGTSLLVTDVNGPEAPPGAASLIGASVAAGRPVLGAYEERSFTFAPGREVNFRNLMIQYALTGRFRSAGSLAKLLDRL